MKKPQTVRLITGKVVPHDLVPLVGLVLQDLNTRDPRMLRELVVLHVVPLSRVASDD